VPPEPDAFKGLQIFWVFNGMRIKGAHGPELTIAAGKKKYEGDYKAVVSVGSGIEASNVCRVVISKAAAALEQSTPSAGTMVGRLAEEPRVEVSAPAPVAWEDAFFNPEDEGALVGASEESAVLAAPVETPQLSPLDLVEKSKSMDLSLMQAEESEPRLSPLEVVEKSKSIDLNVLQAEEGSALIEEWGEAKKEAPVFDLTPEPVAVAASVGEPAPAKPALAPAKVRSMPNPQLARKKKFLESALARWQRNMAKHGKQAA
jgi:hypothetical protein